MAERSTGTALVFGGSTMSYHVLSNFYNIIVSFSYEHRVYTSAEWAFICKKALLAGDQNKQRETIPRLIQEIKKLDRAAWDAAKRAVMKDILLSKFTQHDDLKNYLLSNIDKILDEV